MHTLLLSAHVHAVWMYISLCFQKLLQYARLLPAYTFLDHKWFSGHFCGILMLFLCVLWWKYIYFQKLSKPTTQRIIFNFMSVFSQTIVFKITHVKRVDFILTVIVVLLWCYFCSFSDRPACLCFYMHCFTTSRGPTCRVPYKPSSFSDTPFSPVTCSFWCLAPCPFSLRCISWDTSTST